MELVVNCLFVTSCAMQHGNYVKVVNKLALCDYEVVTMEWAL